MSLSSRIRRFTLVATTCVLAAASAPSWAAVDPEVQKHFDIGNSLYQEGRYSDALREYDAAYTLSKNWKILYNRGQCLVMLKRDPEAVVVFQQYLDEGGAQIAPERRKQIEEDLPKLRARSATILVENAPPGSIVFLGDWRVGPVFKSSSSAGPTELTIPIGAGEYDLRVEPPPGLNAPVFKQHLAITGGMQAAVRVEFETAPTEGVPPGMAPGMAPPPPPPAQVDQPPALPPRPPGGLAAPSFQVSAQVSAVIPSVDTKSVGSFALGAFEIAASYRATSFFEIGLFGDFASGKPTVDASARTIDSVDPNAKYSYRILGARGRLHLLRTKRVDGWFGLDFGAFQENWSFSGDKSFDFKASSAAFGLGLGFDIPLGRSWAIGAAARFIAASANNGARESCSATSSCDGALPGESGSNRATSRSFLDLGAHLVWVLPFGAPEPTPIPASQPKSTVTAAARRNIP
jgi:hypothetical protein